MRTKIGLIVSTAYILGLAIYGYGNWHAIVTLSPNNLGDTLAGVFAPLAFLWLVIGYFQQGEELRQNTEALRLQAEQLKLQVEETKALAVEAGRQAVAATRMSEAQAQLAKIEAQRGLPQFGGFVLSARGKVLRAVSMQNYGATISGLAAYSDSSQVRLKSMRPSTVLQEGGQLDLDWIVLDGALGDFQFWLTYADANGDHRKSEFIVKGDSIQAGTHGVAAKLF